jgi:hypothetical protein
MFREGFRRALSLCCAAPNKKPRLTRSEVVGGARDLIRFFFSTAPHEFLAHFIVAGPMAAVSFSMGLNLKRIWLTTAALVAMKTPR